MKMIITISKGQQITIPSQVREALKLNVGTRLELEQKGKSLVLKPLDEDLEQLFKEAKKTKPKHNWSAEHMDKVIEDELLRR
jgi:AbrB family looped-hinge helix DNA binding protein